MASIVIDYDNNNLEKIAELAGGNPDNTIYIDEAFHVEGVTQEALDAALVIYNDNFEEHCLIPFRQYKKDEFARQSARFIDERYPTYRRELFLALSQEARGNDLTNRLAYINQLMTWVITVVEATIVAENSLDALTDTASINTAVLDLSSFEATDPEITIQAALAIEESSGPQFV